MAEGTRKFIEEHVVPKSCVRMKVQSWREEFLWTLEVNDLLKANEVEITQVF